MELCCSVLNILSQNLSVRLQAATGNSAPIAKTYTKYKEDSNAHKSTGPLPQHILQEMDALSMAQKQSMIETQKQKAEAIKERQQKRQEMKRAIEESRSEFVVYDKLREEEEAELQKALALSSQVAVNNEHDHTETDDLKFAIEQSLLEEQARQEQLNKQFEDDLNKVLQQSAQIENISRNEEDLDLLKILELSLKDEGDPQHINDHSMYSLTFEEHSIVDQQQDQITVTDSSWFYIDPQNSIQVCSLNCSKYSRIAAVSLLSCYIIQGPFQPDMMRAWLAAGYFNGEWCLI